MLRTLLAPLLLLFSSHLLAEEIPLEHCDTLLVVQVQVSGTRFLFLVDTGAVSMLNGKILPPWRTFQGRCRGVKWAYPHGLADRMVSERREK